MQTTPYPARYGFLDGLRGLAALCVVLAHQDVLPFGHEAVLVFFIISGYCITAAAQARRILCRPDDDKIVVHDVAPQRTETGRHEFFLERARMHQQHIGVAVFADFHRRAGTDRDNSYLAAITRLELRQDHRQQSRILGAGGGSHTDIGRCRCSGIDERTGCQRGRKKQVMNDSQHDALPITRILRHVNLA